MNHPVYFMSKQETTNLYIHKYILYIYIRCYTRVLGTGFKVNYDNNIIMVSISWRGCVREIESEN